MLPDRVSNPGPLTYESGALPIELRGPAKLMESLGLGGKDDLTERDHRQWKLSAINSHDRDTWISGVRSAMHAASQLPGRGPLLWIWPLYLHINQKIQ